MEIAGSYPPPKHLLRDLGISLTFKGRDRAILRAPAVPEIRGADGAIGLGVLATLVDVLGGSLAVRAIYPDWIATSDLSLYSTGRAVRRNLVAAGSVLRVGRARVLIEADLYEEPEGGPGTEETEGRQRTDQTEGWEGMEAREGLRKNGAPEGARGSREKVGGARTEEPAASREGARIGYATITLARIPREGETIPVELDDEAETTFTFGGEGTGLGRSLLEEVGVRVLDGRAGIVEVALCDYLANSFRALQGGVVAILAEVAGESASRAAAGKAFVTRALQIQYLSQGRVGPFRTKTRLLHHSRASALSRVEILDMGDRERLIAVGLNTTAARI
jgi:acyl-coenzyme A thioesterase PaaI-like protein